MIPIFKESHGGFLFCLVQHQGEHWGFPKGHPNPGETEEETAQRELKEETGIIQVKVIPEASVSHQYSFEMNGVNYDKSVKYFLALVLDITTAIPDDFKHEISEMKWLPYAEARELTTYQNAKVLLDEVWKYLQNNTL